MGSYVRKEESVIRTLASITEDDEKFITKIILLSGAKYALEFGCGISTLAMSELAYVVSYETDEKFAQMILKENPDLDVRIWDGKTISERLEYSLIKSSFDIAFVDGPAHGENREHSTRIASYSPIVIIHDAQREHEKIWQDKYLKDKFTLIDSNKMCNCWIVTR